MIFVWFWIFKVHITQGDQDGTAMIVSWITPDEPGSSVVLFWSDKHKTKKAEGKAKHYKYHDYTSGYIHHCTIRKLEVNFSLTCKVFCTQIWINFLVFLIFIFWNIIVTSSLNINCIKLYFHLIIFTFCSTIPNITTRLELAKLRGHFGL